MESKSNSYNNCPLCGSDFYRLMVARTCTNENCESNTNPAYLFWDNWDWDRPNAKWVQAVAN